MDRSLPWPERGRGERVSTSSRNRNVIGKKDEMELVSVKVLVIGGVAAGTKAAAKLKREDRGLDVALITKDQDISYAGCGLPYYVGGMIESRDELIVNTPEKYAALTLSLIHI